MRARRPATLLLGALLLARSVLGAAPGNLLRNADFQDDWATQVPQTKTLHWTYASEYQNRRDYNPDGWILKGSWEWQDADRPPGQRCLILRGPKAEVRQRVNWVAVNDDRNLSGFPDAGGFPSFSPVRSLAPLRVVRNLRLRVRARGENVPADGAKLELGLSPPGAVAVNDPMGSVVPLTASATVSLPAGTSDWRWVEVTLPASAWLKAAMENAEKDPKEREETAKSGPVLPGAVSVALLFTGKTGQIEVERAELSEPGPDSPNLLANGGFEKPSDGRMPAGWGAPRKYRYLPPGYYYLFNTWHNDGFANRGVPAVDELVVHGGRRSLRMPVPAGDEISVASAPIRLAQKEPRLVEVTAWVKTDRLNQLQIDALDEKGGRLDGFDFIHKAIVSIGTDEWRLLRQVFRPRQPLQSISIMLCARGVNGYTLDGTGQQPQANAAASVWWDDVRVSEPESTAVELAARGVNASEPAEGEESAHIERLDLGERLFGENVLRAVVVNPHAAGSFSLRFEITSPSGARSTFQSSAKEIASGSREALLVPYVLKQASVAAYTESKANLTLLDGKKQVIGSTAVPLTTWTTPIDLHLGGLYLRPEQKQLVRLNLGLTAAAMTKVDAVRLEIIRRSSGKVVVTHDVIATPQAIGAQRDKIPRRLRGDLTNLVLTDLDVSSLPIERFNEPERRFFVRASVHDRSGNTIASADSDPFCRLAHEPRQPPVTRVRIEGGLLYVNKEPWMPWGAIYGFAPAYDGPADPPPGGEQYLDLHDLPGWSLYDGFTPAPYNRHDNDLNTLRYIPAKDPKLEEQLSKRWQEDNLYASTVFLAPNPGVFSVAELTENAGGKEPLEKLLQLAARAPMVVSTAPGFEEEFAVFHGVDAERLSTLGQLVSYLREKTGKPVMVGHGGDWNRFEFEKVPYFDIYDPETEPLYPANLHTDLEPLVEGKNKVIWLRPQMYESVPYERWRFHTYVELMRGARGWQIAHGPSDQTTLRGLHGELELLKPILASRDGGPRVELEPEIEHWSRRYDGKTYLIAATTHALTLGRWRWDDESKGPAGRVRVTDAVEDDRVAGPLDKLLGSKPPKLVTHAIEYLPEPRRYPAGSRLVQSVRLDPADPPRNVALFAKVDGRWARAVSFGSFDTRALHDDPILGAWFLGRFYRNALGFVGYDGRGLAASLAYLPSASVKAGELPAAGQWVKLEVPLANLGAADAPLEGVGFAHEAGRVFWGHTSIVAADGTESVLWGDSIGLQPAALEHVKIRVAGLNKGTHVRAVFEDRELMAADGYFVDDFRGQDLYQRYGGIRGYGSTPVALHFYEIP